MPISDFIRSNAALGDGLDVFIFERVLLTEFSHLRASFAHDDLLDLLEVVLRDLGVDVHLRFLKSLSRNVVLLAA